MTKCMLVYFPPQFAPHSFVDIPNHSDFQVLDEFMCWWAAGKWSFVPVTV